MDEANIDPGRTYVAHHMRRISGANISGIRRRLAFTINQSRPPAGNLVKAIGSVNSSEHGTIASMFYPELR